MDKKKTLIIFEIGLVVLVSALIIYSNMGVKNEAAVTEKQELKAIDVDYIVENPEKYSGIINIEGKVKEVSDKRDFFSLGCEDDDDASIPVLYDGELPGLKRNVVVTGEIKKDENGKYFFEAKDINYK